MKYANKDTGFVVSVLSETPSSITLAPKGGGPVYRVPKLLFQADFEPQEDWEPTWRSGLFELDEGEGAWYGYTDCRKWNGFECPWFTLHEAQLLLSCETSLSEDSYTSYDPGKDCFYHVEMGERFDMRAQSIKVGDEYLRVYEVSDGWCWYEVSRLPKPEVRPELAFIKEPIDSEQAAKNYLRQLHRTGFAFHPEDDPIDIERSGEPLFNGAEMEHLAARQAELFKHLQDPCAYALFVGMGFQAYGRESDAASTPTWQELVNLEVGEQLPAYPNLWIRRIS